MPPGVWPPHNDARLLAQLMSARGWARGADVLDVFTGSGALALAAAGENARAVTAIDLSRRALLAVRVNARRNGVRVRTLRGDLFGPVAAETFDLILANPPYYPGTDERPGHGLARAWDGGAEGRALIDRFCIGVPERLRPGGRALIVHGSFNGERETCELLARGGLRPEVAVRHSGPWGSVGLRRVVAPARSTGTVGRPANEETLVISAIRAPA